jgi:hypothetical protein
MVIGQDPLVFLTAVLKLKEPGRLCWVYFRC